MIDGGNIHLDAGRAGHAPGKHILCTQAPSGHKSHAVAAPAGALLDREHNLCRIFPALRPVVLLSMPEGFWRVTTTVD